MNKIVTKGFGVTRGLAGRAGLITQGYGGIPKELVEKLEEIIKVTGGNFTHAHIDEIREIVVWAKLIEVNDFEPKVFLQGYDKQVAENKNTYTVIVDFLSSKKKRIFETIKIFIKRLL